MVFRRFNGNNRVKQTGRTNNLFNNLCAVFPFKRTGCSRSENNLIYLFIKLIKHKRAVIKRTRKSKTIFHKTFFSCSVTCIHTSDLRKHYMAFITKKKKIIRHIINKCKRSFTGFSAAHYGRIVFNSLAKACFPKHFNIIHCSLFNSLCFKKFAFGFKLTYAFNHFIIYFIYCFIHFFRADNIVRSRINCNMRKYTLNLSRKRLNFTNSIYFIAEKFNSDCCTVRTGRKNFNSISPNPEFISDKVNIVSFILN